jgi:hypothetical protein
VSKKRGLEKVWSPQLDVSIDPVLHVHAALENLLVLDYYPVLNASENHLVYILVVRPARSIEGVVLLRLSSDWLALLGLALAVHAGLPQ